MNQIIESKRDEVAELCRRFHVRRLDVFGSATSDRFDPARSDIDFVVEFEEMEAGEHSKSWFGFLFALEELFSRPVDLITYKYIRNPYFKASIDESRVNLYAA